MRYSETKQFQYDTELFQRYDTQIGLKFYDEYVRRNGGTHPSGEPAAKFFEVDRSFGQMDPVWRASATLRTQFTSRSPISISTINKFTRNQWKNSKTYRTVARDDSFILSHLSLIRADYFPEGGDQIFWNGYRYMIVHVTIPGEAYFGQTGVWTGLVCECVIVPEGDARPTADLSQTVPAEVSPKVTASTPIEERPKQEHLPLLHPSNWS